MAIGRNMGLVWVILLCRTMYVHCVSFPIIRVGVNQESKPEESGAGIGGIYCVPASKQPKSNVHQHIQQTCLETIPA